MALFLAGLRGVDDSIIKAAQVDGAGPAHLHAHHHPVAAAGVLQRADDSGHIAIKSFDLVMALTAGGPGYSSDLPATFMYTFSFKRGQIGLGAASAMMMLSTSSRSSCR